MPFDGTNLSQTKRNLIAARELLIEKGWAPRAGSFSQLRGPNCIFSAICCTSNVPWAKARDNPAVKAVETAAGGTIHLPNWNDAQTSIEPVLTLLDEAIAAA